MKEKCHIKIVVVIRRVVNILIRLEGFVEVTRASLNVDYTERVAPIVSQLLLSVIEGFVNFCQTLIALRNS